MRFGSYGKLLNLYYGLGPKRYSLAQLEDQRERFELEQDENNVSIGQYFQELTKNAAQGGTNPAFRLTINTPSKK